MSFDCSTWHHNQTRSALGRRFGIGLGLLMALVILSAAESRAELVGRGLSPLGQAGPLVLQPIVAEATESPKAKAAAPAPAPAPTDSKALAAAHPATKTEGFLARIWHSVTRTVAGWYHGGVRWIGSWFAAAPAPAAGRAGGASAPLEGFRFPSWTPNWLLNFLGVPPKPKGRLDGTGKIVIAVDPGHGGSDPGAIAPDGWQEKHLTLAVAQRLKLLLESRGNYRVILTRVDDSRIDLEDRVNLAVVDGAVVFVSLHANYLDGKHSQTVRGAMVLTLTPEATDAVAAKIAANENNAAIDGGLKAAPEALKALIGLEQRETRRQAIQLARITVQELHNHGLPISDNPVRGDNLVVLRSPTMPSILVEMGFLSNPDDTKRLRSAQGQAQIAAALARAIRTESPGTARCPVGAVAAKNLLGNPRISVMVWEFLFLDSGQNDDTI